MSDRGGAAPLTGGVSLSDALSALRDELVHAVWAGQYPYQFDGAQRTLRFKPAPIEVTLEVAVTATGEGHAGVKWWLIDAGGAFSREKVTTQTVKPMLEPLMFDEAGRPVEVLVDAPDGGNLADRGRRQSSATVADLLNGKHLLQYNDIRSFTSMNDDKLEILASAEYGAARHAFDDAAWANATDIVSHYYNLILADGGAGLLQPAARGVLSTVSAVVIVTGACVDGARLAAATLDWLRQNGYQHLLARACVVINHLIPGKPGVDMADLVVQFQRYVAPGRVVVLPWDKHVAAGTEIQLDLLSRRFRRGTVELAAALSDDFDRVEQHTPRDSRS